MSNKIDLDRLFAEDGGRRYIISRYPDAEESFENTNRKFSIRKESTPSASLKRMKSSEWGVTDFGNDSKWRNAIHIAMLEDGLDYGHALGQVCKFYNYQDEYQNFQPKPTYEERPARPDEPEGHVVTVPKELSEAEIRTILKDNAWEALGPNDDTRKQRATALFAMYHCKALKSYTTVYEGKALTTLSTEEFPIFYFDEGDWGKIYRPKARHDKRFRYVGNKPAHFIHGLRQAQDFVAQAKKDQYDKQSAAAAAEEFRPSADDVAKEIERVDVRFPEVIGCSGGSDALNVAALGYRVVWLNSETATLRGSDYAALMKLAYKIYNLPDIDITGKLAGHQLANKYLNLYTIWLPEKILKVDATTGKATSKDLRDYLKTHKKKDFDRLVATALPYRFWDMERVVDDEGNPKMAFGRPVVKYKFNHVQAYNFLYRSGFARFKSERDKEGFFYVQVMGNVVRKVEAQEVKNYLHFFLEERSTYDDQITLDLRNSMYTTNQLSVSNLANLPLIDLDFVASGAEYQYLFFPNCTWKVTAQDVEESKGLATSKYVWEDKVIIYPTKDGSTPRVRRLDAMFRIDRQDDGTYDIALLDKSCMFFRFMINTARVHWRKELEERQTLWMTHDKPQKQDEYISEHGLTQAEAERFLKVRSLAEQQQYLKEHQFSIAGPLLTTAEQQEQKLHLINRIYTLGYMMHRYKDPSRAWCVWAMDNKLSEMAGEDAKSNGGSGKSLTGKALKWIWRYHVSFSGRNPQLTKNAHIYDKVTRHSDLMIVDDCFEYLDFGFFYGDITGDMNPNPKQTQSYTIPYDESPKFWFDSNFGDRDFSESTQRRKLVTAFADYYHENNGNYNETRKPTDDFDGRRLFYDFTADDWNRFYNFLGQCLRFYLACPEKIKPPMNNIQKRNLLSSMGGRFFEWAEIYFGPESGRLNSFCIKLDAKQEYMDSEKIRDLSTQKFSEYLRKYADYHAYTLNPEQYCNSQGRIVREINSKRQELIYFETRAAASAEQTLARPGNPNTPDDAMPF